MHIKKIKHKKKKLSQNLRRERMNLKESGGVVGKIYQQSFLEQNPSWLLDFLMAIVHLWQQKVQQNLGQQKRSILNEKKSPHPASFLILSCRSLFNRNTCRPAHKTLDRNGRGVIFFNFSRMNNYLRKYFEETCSS